MARSMMDGSDSIAAERNESPGRNSTTNSGEGSIFAQYSAAGEGIDVPAHLRGVLLEFF